MISDWAELKYWSTGEWQVVWERLRHNRFFCPGRKDLFKSLKVTPFKNVRVAIIADGLYGIPKYDTGIPFSISVGSTTFPGSLVNIFKEYSDDLHYPYPTSGSLVPWTAEVLLWNVYPSSPIGKPKGHHWLEWEYLTLEIVKELSSKGVVFLTLGSIAKNFTKDVDLSNNRIYSVGHPSSLANSHINTKNRFLGSRPFTTVNALLCELNQQPIDWRL